ncbi:MAG: septum formation inhibitor Maf [Phaeodactylibacter sp.]|nr:septum formation inhibitor Maf [Phaeodactylibacter sp.]
MKTPLILTNSLLGTWLLLACQSPQKVENYANFTSMPDNDQFSKYWYQGEAEVNSYQLTINRYGEDRWGDAVLVFVTEDFSASKQVKLDNPAEAEGDKIPVLKLNELWKFKTGIYDYSMMQSVFTPVSLKQHPKTLKVSTSSQDWCGHTFTQINLQDNKDYQYRQFSYFESEGDIDKKLKDVLLEDELLTRLRIDPDGVPTGEVDLLPGNFFLRLSHEHAEPHMARIQKKSTENANELVIEYMHLDRTVIIAYETNFPYKILSWEESNSKGRRVRATLKNSIKSPYWQRNSNRYSGLRDTLQLNF